MSEKYKVRIVNETVIEDINENEINLIAEILENRNSMPKFLGALSYTYSEIEKVTV